MSAVFARYRSSSHSRKLIVKIGLKEWLMGNPGLLEPLESIEKLKLRIDPTQYQMGMLFSGREIRACQLNGRMNRLYGDQRGCQVLPDQNIDVGNLRELGRLQHGFLLWLVEITIRSI